MADLRGRRGGVAAVVAAFWLGFVCGGGSLPGAAVIGEVSGQPAQEPAPASQSSQEPAPASQPPQEPVPASQSSQEPVPASQSSQEPAPASQPPQEPVPASQPPQEPVPASQPPQEPAAAASQPPEEPDPAPAPDEPAQADSVPAEEATQADAAPEEPTEPDAEAEAAPVPEPPLVQDRPREFTARNGVVLNFVSSGGESAFEETMTRVAEAFAASESEERQQQAEGWSTYKAEEPLADGVILYVSWFDPAVPGADYWVPGILNEAFPTEAQTLYETYAGAFADGQILLNLVPVAGP